MAGKTEHRGGANIAAILATLDERLENETEVLDAFLLALSRNQLKPDAWEKLHGAAKRFDRVSELAFAFEELTGDRRLKTLQASVVAEFMFQGAVYFGDIFGDEMGSSQYLDRALAALPTHAGAITRLETSLTKAGDFKRLGDLFAELAAHRPRAEQTALFRRAADAYARSPGLEEREAEMLLQISRLDPTDEDARTRLEGALLAAGRLKDLAKLLEQALGTDPPPDANVANRARLRLLDVYGKTKELEKALPHAEALIAQDAAAPEAREVLLLLIESRTTAARAAAALANASRAMGAFSDAVRFLSVELETVRGPRRAIALKTLAELKHDRMDDAAGAFEAAEQAIALDASDGELIERYLSLVRALGKHAEAVKTLGRLGSVAKDPQTRVRLSGEMGELLLAMGDMKRARAAFSSALSVPSADDASLLPVAHALARLFEEDEDHNSLADMLERIVRSEPDVTKRQEAAERLGELAANVLNDPQKAIVAYRGLLKTPARARALEALEPLLSSMGDAVGYAEILRERARDTQDPAARKALMITAAKALTEASGNLVAASDAWREITDQFGTSDDVLEQWLPLLELQADWPTMEAALLRYAEGHSGAQKAAILARAGAVRAQKIHDPVGAIQCFRKALEVDPNETASKAALEQMLLSEDDAICVAAAMALEPIYRRDGSHGGLFRVLFAHATRGKTIEERRAATAEALGLAPSLPNEAQRAIALIERSIADTVSSGESVAFLIDHLLRLMPSESDAPRVAEVLYRALGNRPIDSDAKLELASRTGDALARGGDAPHAIEVYRRVLERRPDQAIFDRMDELLRTQGSPDERLQFHSESLAREADPMRRRAIFASIARVQKMELSDSVGAAHTLVQALQEDPQNFGAAQGLLDVYIETNSWASACELLDQIVGRMPEGDALPFRIKLVEIASTHGQPDRAKSHLQTLLSDPQLPTEALDSLEASAERVHDGTALCRIAEFRVARVESAEERIVWLSRLGALRSELMTDVAGALSAWKQAASLANQAGDTKTARKLYDRIRKVSPYDAEATTELAVLLEASGDYGALPELYAVLVESAASDPERLKALLLLARTLHERANDASGAFDTAARAFAMFPDNDEALNALAKYAIVGNGSLIDAFVKSIEAPLNATQDGAARARLLLARAGVVGTIPERRVESLEELRRVITDASVPMPTRKTAAERFEPVAGEDAQTLRWVYEWRSENLSGEDRLDALARWARLEDQKLGDPQRSLDLWRKLAIENHPDASSEVARLTLATGDFDGAIAALRGQTDAATDVATKLRLRAEIAAILLLQEGREGEAMDELSSALGESPDHPGALRETARLLPHPTYGEKAAALLSASLATATDDDAKVRVLTALVDGAKDAPEENRRAWFADLLAIVEGRGPDKLYEVLLKALRQFPLDHDFWDRAERLARDLDRPTELADLYHAALSKSLGPDEALEVGQRAVAFQEEWFDDQAGVIRTLDRLVDIDPGGWAFDRLKLLYDAQERWDDLFALYDRVTAAVSDAHKRALLLEDAAQVAKDFAKNAPRAIGYLEQLLNLRPDNERLIASLERLYERYGRHRELISLLGAQVANRTPAEAQAFRGRMARLWLDELHDAGSALLVIEEMIAEGDLTETSLGLLENVLQSADAAEEVKKSIPPVFSPVSERIAQARESVPPRASAAPTSRASVPPPGRSPSGKRGKRVLVRQRAASLLRDRYAASGKDADLARVMEVELEAVKNAKERIRRHREMAALYEKLGNDASALEHGVSLVMLEPDDATHREHLEQLAQRTGRYERFAEVLALAAEDGNDDVLRVELLRKAADVHEVQLGDPPRAIDLYFRVLALEGPADVLNDAATRLERLLEQGGRQLDRLGVLERIAQHEKAAERQRDILGVAARLATELGEVDRAIAAWEGRVKIDDTDMEALDGLVVLLSADAGRARPLIDALERRARAQASDREKSRADRVRVGTILSETLDEPREAISTWEGIENDFGEADDVTEALARLYTREQKWKKLADTVQRAAKRAADDAARAALLVRLGDVQREHTRTPRNAVESYEEALNAAPGNEGALAGLRAMLEGDDAARAVDVLLASYRRDDAWVAALELLPHRLRTAKNDAARVEVLLEVASVAETRANDASMAFDAIHQAFLVSRGEERIEDELLRLAAVADGWRIFVEAHRAAIETLEGESPRDVERLCRLRYRMGEVTETQLDDARAALAAYMRVVADAPLDDAAGVAAIRTAARTQRWDAVAKVVLDRAITTAANEGGVFDETLLVTVEAVTSGPAAWDAVTSAFESAIAERGDGVRGPVARDIEARVATWHRDRRGDADASEAAYTRSLAHDPANADLLRALAQLQRRSRGRPLIDSLLRLSQATGGDLDLLREAADVASNIVVDRGLAKTILERLLKLAAERWVEALTPKSERADSESGPVTTRRPSQAMLAASGVTLGEPSVQHTIEHVEHALAELVRIHNEEGNAERIVELLTETSKLPFPRDRSRALRREAAGVALDRIGDNESALSLYRGLFDEDADDRVAADRLADIYTTLERREDLLSLRRTQIKTAKDAAWRVELRLDAARIERELGRVNEAILALRENLREAPRHPTSTATLSAVLEQTERFADLADFCAEQAALAEGEADVFSAVELWAKAAAIAEKKLDDLGRAIAHLKRVLALEVRANALDSLASIHERRGEHAESAQYLDKLVTDFPERRSEFIMRLANALVKAERDEVAQERLEVALRGNASPPEVGTLLGEIYRRNEKWSPLAELLTARATAATSDSDKLALLKEAAELHMQKGNAAERAVPLLEAATTIAPDDRVLKLTLAGALRAAGRIDDARTLLKAMIDAFAGRRPKERATVHFHLARLHLGTENRTAALSELEAATKIDPANPEILRMVAELARDDGQLEKAERSYRALLAVLRRGEENDAAPILRTEVLVELSEIAGRQNEEERSQEILESAFEAAASSDAEARRLERTLRDKGKIDALVRALEARLERSGNEVQAAEVLSELALTLEGLGRAEDALKAQLRALATAPGSAPTHEKTIALARRSGSFAVYVDKLASLAEENASNAELASSLLTRAGEAMRTELADPVRAAELLERALVRTPGKLEVLRALDRVYGALAETTKQDTVLAQLAKAELEAQPRDPKIAGDVLHRFAARRLERSEEGDTDEAAKVLSSAFDIARDAKRTLEILKPAVDKHRTHVALVDLMERIGRDQGDEDTLLVALLSKAERTNATMEVLREAALLSRRKSDRKSEERVLELCVQRARDEKMLTLARWALLDLAALRDEGGDLARATRLRLEASDVSNAEEARALRGEVAQVALGQLNDPELAQTAWDKMLDADPRDREAATALADTHRASGDNDKLIRVLIVLIDLEQEPDIRATLRAERAGALAAIGRKDEAVAELRSLLEDNPQDENAGSLLFSLLESSGNVEELAGIIERQLEAAKDRGDGQAVAALSMRLGSLIEKNDVERAKSIYFAGLDWDPKHRDLLRAQLRLTETSDPVERAELLERVLESDEGPEAETLALQLSEIRAEQWDSEGAERALELGLRAHPASTMLREKLMTSYGERGDNAKIALLHETVASALSGEEAAPAWREAARIHRDVLNDAASAARALRGAWEASGHDATILAELIACLENSGDADVALTEITAILKQASDARVRASLQAHRATILARVGRADDALADAEAAAALDPAHAELVVTILDQAAAETPDPVLRRELTLRLVDSLVRGGRSAEALTKLQSLVFDDPQDRDLLRRFADLAEAQHDWRAASEAYQRLVVAEDDSNLLPTALRLADVSEKAGVLAFARGGLEKARQIFPLDESIAIRLRDLYEKTHAYRELADMLAADAAASHDPNARFDALLRAGQLFLGRANDADRAIVLLEAAQKLKPADLHVTSLLAEGKLQVGLIDEASALLKASLAALKGRRSKEASHIYHCLARVERAQGNRPGEIQMLSHALDMDAQNGVVASELAEIALAAGQTDVAVKALRTITMLKTPAPLPRAIAYQRLGEIAAHAGDRTRAIMLLKRAIEDDATLERARALLAQLEGR